MDRCQRDYRRLLGKARLRAGWQVIMDRRHVVLRAPWGAKLFCARSHSDHRGMRNVERDLPKIEAARA